MYPNFVRTEESFLNQLNQKQKSLSPLNAKNKKSVQRTNQASDFSVKPQLRSNQVELNSLYETYTKLGEIQTRMQSISSSQYLGNQRSPIASAAFILTTEKSEQRTPKVKPVALEELNKTFLVNEMTIKRDQHNFSPVFEANEEETQRATKSPFQKSAQLQSLLTQRKIQQHKAMVIKTTKTFFDTNKLYLKSAFLYQAGAKSQRKNHFNQS